jgi:hypothetical protein
MCRKNRSSEVAAARRRLFAGVRVRTGGGCLRTGRAREGSGIGDGEDLFVEVASKAAESSLDGFAE